MKINILRCDSFTGQLPQYIPSYESMFFKLFDSISDLAEYTVYDVEKGELPETLPDGELYLITGSNASAYNHSIPWLKKLILFIRQAHSRQAKLAGICFGHQIIASALGGKVEQAPQGWSTGIRTSRINALEGLKYFPEGEMRLHYDHHDQITLLPAEAQCFATSDFCPYDGFTIGHHILTFQGHPEYSSRYSRYLLLNHSEFEPESVKKEALKSLDTQEAQGRQAARWIMDL